MEISEDAAASGIKYFEISIDPFKFISKVLLSFVEKSLDKRLFSIIAFQRIGVSQEYWTLYAV